MGQRECNLVSSAEKIKSFFLCKENKSFYSFDVNCSLLPFLFQHYCSVPYKFIRIQPTIMHFSNLCG